MSSPCLAFSLFLSLSLSLSVLLSSLPPTFAVVTINDAYSVQDVDLSDKQGRSFFIDFEEDPGYIHIGAPATQVGQHLGTVRDAIKVSEGESKLVVDASVEALTMLLNDSYPLNYGEGGQDQKLVDHKNGTSQWSLAMYPFLKYFEGSVMANKKANEGFLVYVVYYGRGWTDVQKDIVQDFINGLTPAKGAPKERFDTRTLVNYWKVITENYYEISGGVKRYVTWNVTLMDSYSDTGSISGKGTKTSPLTDSDIRKIVLNAFKMKFNNPITVRAVTLVLTDPTIYVDSFCSSSCSYHSSFRSLKKRIAYAHIGDSSTQCSQLCTFQYFSGTGGGYIPANDDLGIDGMVSWIAHELQSVATNPFQSRKVKPGWVVAATNSPIEVGDFCEWDYGYYGFTNVGGSYNVEGGGRKFLVQRVWNRNLTACTVTFGGLDQPMPFNTPS